MRNKLLIILVAVILASCYNTFEYSQNGKRMNSFVDCAYMGTFSSISVIKDKKRKMAEFNDTLTAIANEVYDSVVKAKVKYLKPVNITSALSEEANTELTKEITRCAIDFYRNGNLDSLHPAPIVNNVAHMTNTRYASYFINYGKIWSKKQHRRYVGRQALIATAVVVGVALLVTLEVMLIASGDGGRHSTGNWFDNSGSSSSSSSSSSSVEAKYEPAVTCFYLVYDKEINNFCYIRRADFNSDRTDNDVFNPMRVSEQINILFGKRAKTVKNS